MLFFVLIMSDIVFVRRECEIKWVFLERMFVKLFRFYSVGWSLYCAGDD